LNANFETPGQPAAFKSRAGKLWFASHGSIAVVDPAELPVQTGPLPVHIEDCTVEANPVPCRDRLAVRPGQQNLEIRYTVISYYRSEEIRFRYRVAGLDTHWTDAGTRRIAYLSHLPPGEYKFEVTAANGEGVWNLSGDSIGISVAAPWYQTWWFYALCVTAATLVVSAAWRFRVAQLVRAREAQQRFLQQLIGSQEAERKRLAGELHDGLGQRLTIMKNLALLELRVPALSEKKNGHLDALSQEISGALAEVRAISYALRPYQLDFLGLKEALEALVKTVSAASTTVFASRFDDINDLFPKDSEINVYRIAQECLNNIVKHSHAQHVEITVAHRGNRVQLEITDDGVGFTHDSSRVGEPRVGLGLTSMSERVELLGGSMELHSSPGKGTNIRIDLPCIG
jgi:signal transduction histidine kinase